MIYLNSGRPGSGKTLNAIQRGMAWIKEGRTVYALGINGLDEKATGIQVYNARLEEWATRLLPGDVLIVDEIQFFIKKGSTSRTIPEWVEELTRNRHHGIDFLWTTQDPKNIDPFIRRLVNEHRHFVNKFGGPKAVVYTWHDGVDEPDSPSQRERSEKTEWSYPVDIYRMYTSAQLHTRKKRMPRMYKMLIWSLVACIVLVAGVVLLSRTFLAKPNAARSAASAITVGSDPLAFSSSLTGGSQPAHILSRKEWIARQVPRVDGMPWSAPIFDDRKVMSKPEILCILYDQVKCKCYTEQVTPLDVEAGLCKNIATNGVYNPYREAVGQGENRTRGDGDRSNNSGAISPAVARSVDNSPAGAGDADHAILHPVAPPYQRAPAY